MLKHHQMRWMDSFLDAGEVSGKIICPNKKCNAKLGNYDWVGVCCGCKEWVIPVRFHLALRLPPVLTQNRDFVSIDLRWMRYCDI